MIEYLFYKLKFLTKKKDKFNIIITLVICWTQLAAIAAWAISSSRLLGIGEIKFK